MDSWSKRQWKVFKKFFEPSDEKKFSISEIREKTEDYSQAWRELYPIIWKSGLKVSEYSRIDCIDIEKDKRGKEYLVVEITYGRFLVIDCLQRRCLTDSEVINNFDFNYIYDRFLGKRSELEFESVGYETCDALIEQYMSKSDIYEKGPSLNYKVSRKRLFHEDDKAYFHMDLVSKQWNVSFVGDDDKNDKKDGYVNYLFFEGDRLDGMSGDCDRSIAFQIGQMSKEIQVPESVIKNYTLDGMSLEFRKD